MSNIYRMCGRKIYAEKNKGQRRVACAELYCDIGSNSACARRQLVRPSIANDAMCNFVSDIPFCGPVLFFGLFILAYRLSRLWRRNV